MIEAEIYGMIPRAKIVAPGEPPAHKHVVDPEERPAEELAELRLGAPGG